MSNPFHDLANQYDALTEQLRTTGDQWALGTLGAEEPAAEPADTPTSKTDKK